MSSFCIQKRRQLLLNTPDTCQVPKQGNARFVELALLATPRAAVSTDIITIPSGGGDGSLQEAADAQRQSRDLLA